MENEKKKERRKKLLLGFSIAGLVIAGTFLALFLGAVLYFHFLAVPYGSDLGVIGGADGPTAIFVSTGGPDPAIFPAVMAAILGLSVFGVCKAKRK